jgi:hypothetical protein
MKIFLLFLLSINFCIAIYSQTSFRIFPGEKIYRNYYADAISNQFSLLKDFGSNEWYGNIGTDKPLLTLTIDDNVYQFTAAATVFSTLKITPPHIQVFTADYLVDFFFDRQLSDNFILRFNWGHLSAHFVDDGILQLNEISINYVRDYVGLQAEKLISMINGKAYAAFTYNFHNEPRKNKHIRMQFGFDAGKKILENLLIYFAFDFKMKAEVNNGTTKAMQIGLKYPPVGDSCIRLAYTFRTGYDERGQLYDKTSSRNILGLYFDF